MIIGDRFEKSELQTMLSEELRREIDRQARILVQTLVNLLGCDGDKLQAEYYFIGFCRRYAREHENRWEELRQHFHGQESATASPQHLISAAPSSSSSPSPRCPIDYVTSPIQHPISAAAAAAPSTSATPTEEFSPPTLLQSGQDLIESPSPRRPTARSIPGPSQESGPKRSRQCT